MRVSILREHLTQSTVKYSLTELLARLVLTFSTRISSRIHQNGLNAFLLNGLTLGWPTIVHKKNVLIKVFIHWIYARNWDLSLILDIESSPCAWKVKNSIYQKSTSDSFTRIHAQTDSLSYDRQKKLTNTCHLPWPSVGLSERGKDTQQ